MARFVKRMLLTSLGLFIYAVGEYLTIQACIGLSPWTCLSMGVSYHVPFTYGTVHVAISLVIVAADVLMGEKIGFGTLLDALLIGTFVDMIAGLGLVPAMRSPIAGIFMMCAGELILAFGQFIYMREGLGCGPRDSLTLALGRKLPRIPIGTVAIGELAIVLVVGAVLGGPIGIGTVITTLGEGFSMQFVFNLLRFEPRSVVHENLHDTLLAIGRDVRRA